MTMSTATMSISATPAATSASVYAYFPGCSLHSTGLEYGQSTLAVFRSLGIDLVELEGWNCCGASSAHALDHQLSLALPARNLALAQEMGASAMPASAMPASAMPASAGVDLVAPCAACYNRMKTADTVLRNDPQQRAEIEASVGFEYTGQVKVRPTLAVLGEDIGAAQLAARVKKKLTGLKVVPYYGCLLVRPPQIAQFDDPEDPQVMTEVLQALGAEVMRWSYATDCCGAGLSLSRSDLVKNLVGSLVAHAREAGAQALVTACPLCQVNLEMRQPKKPARKPAPGTTPVGHNPDACTAMPAFYFTELVGLALQLPESRKWWPKHLIDPRPVLRSVGLWE